MDENFFRYQHRRLGILWGWGLASSVLGTLGLFLRPTLLRHIAIQTSSWGAIDAVLAWFGRRSAAAKDLQLREGLLNAQDVQRESSRFRTILLINALLDLGYIAAGAILARQEQPDRRGMGLGIIPQGVFLFLFDTLFAWEIARRDRGHVK